MSDPDITTQAPSILVAIASYGTKQDHYLQKVLAEYHKWGGRCRIVVLSNVPKQVNGAEVLAGLPSPDPYSLPFAHRKLFADHADRFDLFIYTEDDTLLTKKHIDAFLNVQRHLPDDEIAGFVRSETSPDGLRFITSIHHHFRWLPEGTQERGGELFAQLSNDHSGCFIATRAQLRRAIDSGKFLVEPHAETYGMLESAASDIYRQCGLRRVLCVSRLNNFIVPHLPNKYFHEMGITLEELDQQVRAVREVHETRGWQGVLLEPETRAPGFRWSKDLYSKPDETLLQMLPLTSRHVLSVGAASGREEEWLTRRGITVEIVALDSVFAGTLRQRGFQTVEGPLEEVLEKLNEKRFDAVLMTDVLHLVDDPIRWLKGVRKLLVPSGQLVARVDNTGELSTWLKDLWRGRGWRRFPNFSRTGVQAVSAGRVRGWCAESGFSVTKITPSMPTKRRRRLGWLASSPIEPLFASAFILTAARSDKSGSHGK